MNSASESKSHDFEDDRATADRATAAIRIITAALDAIGEAESRLMLEGRARIIAIPDLSLITGFAPSPALVS